MVVPLDEVQPQRVDAGRGGQTVGEGSDAPANVSARGAGLFVSAVLWGGPPPLLKRRPLEVGVGFGPDLRTDQAPELAAGDVTVLEVNAPIAA